MTKFVNFQKMGKKSELNSSKMVKDFIINDKSSMVKTFVAYGNNLKWFTENREKLRAKYGDMYVAIYQNKVCIHKTELPSLLKEVKKKYGTSQEVVVDYIGREKVGLLL
jgi:mevalonate kinase